MDQLLLAQERLDEEKRRGLWPDRVITDYLDRWLAEKPEACALVSWREESQTVPRHCRSMGATGDETDIMTRLMQSRPDRAADATGAEDDEPHGESLPWKARNVA
jgi:hypothetical protein